MASPFRTGKEVAFADPDIKQLASRVPATAVARVSLVLMSFLHKSRLLDQRIRGRLVAMAFPGWLSGGLARPGCWIGDRWKGVPRLQAEQFLQVFCVGDLLGQFEGGISIFSPKKMWAPLRSMFPGAGHEQIRLTSDDPSDVSGSGSKTDLSNVHQ